MTSSDPVFEYIMYTSKPAEQLIIDEMTNEQARLPSIIIHRRGPTYSLISDIISHHRQLPHSLCWLDASAHISKELLSIVDCLFYTLLSAACCSSSFHNHLIEWAILENKHSKRRQSREVVGGGIGTIENNAQPGELLSGGRRSGSGASSGDGREEQMEGNQYLNNQSLERLSMKIRVNLTTTSIVCTHDFHSFTIYLPIPPNVWSSSHYRQLFFSVVCRPSSASRDCLLFGNSKAQAVDGCPTCKWQYRSSHIAARLPLLVQHTLIACESYYDVCQPLMLTIASSSFDINFTLSLTRVYVCINIEEELKTRQQQQLHSSSEKMNEIPVLRDREEEQQQRQRNVYHVSLEISDISIRVSGEWERRTLLCCAVVVRGRMKRKWRKKMKLSCTYTWQCLSLPILKAFLSLSSHSRHWSATHISRYLDMAHSRAPCDVDGRSIPIRRYSITLSIREWNKMIIWEHQEMLWWMLKWAQQ